MLKMFAEIIDGKVGLVRAFEMPREEVPDGWVDVDAHPEVRRGYLYDGSTFTKQPPPQVGVVSFDPKEIELGETSTITIIAKTNKYPSGTVREDFDESVNISAINGQGIELRHKFTFVDGVASKEITPKVEGVYTLGDSGRMDLQLTGDKEIDVLTP
jgi:hypothetical protein